MAVILVVDTSAADRQAIVNVLGEAGHEVAEADSAAAALAAARQRRVDLMVVNWALPDVSGLDVLTSIKQGEPLNATRVVMMSAVGESANLVAAFQSGADDVVTKPLDLDELKVRIEVALKRPAASHGSEELRAGGIKVDAVGHRVFADGVSLTLAPREYRLLTFLMANRDRVFSRAQLLVHVWDRNAGVGVRTVDVHVRRLRSLLEPYRYDAYLQTVRGSGYRFSPEH